MKNKILVGVSAVLATVAFIFFYIKKKGDNDDRPPKKAPQLPIDNPGEQSEFTTSASESEIG